VKKTPWFNAKKYNPVRNGWYEVRCKFGVFGGYYEPEERLYWDKAGWYFYKSDPGLRRVCSFGHKCNSWRGLVKESK